MKKRESIDAGLLKIKSRGRAAAAGLREATDDVPTFVRRFEELRKMVTPLGIAVAGCGVTAWIVGWLLGWLEFMIVAAACLLLLLASVCFVLGRSSLKTRIALDPPRVAAGDSSAGQVVVANPSSGKTAAARVELPIGTDMAVFEIPGLASDQTHEDLFVISTDRRGVIPVGPATSIRSDPLSLFQRKASASDQLELIVHPRTVPLSSFGSGLLRDLEGLTTKDLSVSDLAFHALREYVPGDDRRHIHWRSSAKTGQLLVRQFLDTRRSALCVLVDTDSSGFATADEFECALEVAGSIALRACRDGIPAVLVAGTHAATGVHPHLHLDALARAELSKSASDLPMQANRLARQDADVSVAVIISGSLRTPDELDRAGSRLPPDVRVLGIRIVPDESSQIAVTLGGVVAQLGNIRELPGLLKKDLAA